MTMMPVRTGTVPITSKARMIFLRSPIFRIEEGPVMGSPCYLTHHLTCHLTRHGRRLYHHHAFGRCKYEPIILPPLSCLDLGKSKNGAVPIRLMQRDLLDQRGFGVNF